MNNKPAIKDIFEPSPSLGYMLEPSAQEYYAGSNVSDWLALPREKLIIDVVNHILDNDITQLKDVVDSLIFFYQLIYDSIYELESGVPAEYDILKITSSYTDDYLDRASIMISMPLTCYHFIWDDSNTKDFDNKDLTYILSREKIKRYPDMQSVLHKAQDITNAVGYELAGTALAALYIVMDQLDNAIQVYVRKKHIGSMGNHDYYNLGTIYMQRNDTIKAIEQFEKINELNEARYHIGMAYMYDGEWDKAAGYFEKLAEDYNSSYQTGYIETVTLSQIISQFSWNNLGICCYRNMNNGSVRTRLVKALDMFQKAALWEQVTFRPEGKHNINQATELLKDIVDEHTKPSSIRKLGPVSLRNGYSGIIGKSDAMQKVYDNIERVARNDISVLITGEPGTGKELVAHAIHNNSSRRDKPYIFLNCSAIPKELIENELFGHEKGAFTNANSRMEGKFEQANNGTLFLDEIGEMSLDAQAKLLRVVEYKEFTRGGGKELVRINTRIIAATNRDLKTSSQDGRFREDLYHRLDKFRIHLPPLRDRKDDIPLLIEYFLKNSGKNRRLTLSDPAMEMLIQYNWPGNIRVLKNAIESAATRAEGDIIHSWDLPEDILKALGINESIEKLRIIEAYKASNGNATKATNILGMPKSTFYYKVDQYGIKLNTIKKELKKRN